MECQASDSKKVLKVFDASKRKKCRERKEKLDDTNSLCTDESKSQLQQPASHCIKSADASLQDLTLTGEKLRAGSYSSHKRQSSPSATQSPVRNIHRGPRSPRRHRRLQRDDRSLALNAGFISTPRSNSPHQDGEGLCNSIPVDEDSFIYTFLEEAIKQDKKKHRRRRAEDNRSSRDHERHDRSPRHDRTPTGDALRERQARSSDARGRDRHYRSPPGRDREHDDTPTGHEHHRHRHHKRHDVPFRDDEDDKPVKEKCQPPPIDHNVLFETFAKLCSTITEKSSNMARPPVNNLTRNQSHKSLQCEVVKNELEMDQRPERLRSREPSHESMNLSYTRVRSLEDMHGSRSRIRSPARAPDERKEKYCQPYERLTASSKIEVVPSRTRALEEERYRDYPTRCMLERHDSKLYDERRVYGVRRDSRLSDERHDRRYEDARRRLYEEERRRWCDEKTSRSFEPRRELAEERLRRSTRSEARRQRAAPRDKYCEDREREYRERHSGRVASRERPHPRTLDRGERMSVVSRDDEKREMFFKERDVYSEKERDSGLSVADEISTVSGKSDYLRVVKHGIAEQREAMEKMMKLWKELMRCFKSVSQNPVPDKVTQESAASVQESAAAQLRLWRECMRRYETVARDVGDTDARLMDEINKQRSEMAEMANMWQECLQRYRDMSNDFNNLKQQLVTEVEPRSQLPARAPAPCPEREPPPGLPYRMHPAYPLPPQPLAMGPGMGYPASGLHARASAPPAWWWLHEAGAGAGRRRSSPDSRRSSSRDRRDRRHRHRDRDREDTKYKEKSSAKPNAARSEHRHRKR